jgi:cyanate lyase
MSRSENTLRSKRLYSRLQKRSSLVQMLSAAYHKRSLQHFISTSPAVNRQYTLLTFTVNEK